ANPAGSVGNLRKREPVFPGDSFQLPVYSRIVMHGAVDVLCPASVGFLCSGSLGVHSPRPLIISKRGRLASHVGGICKMPLILPYLCVIPCAGFFPSVSFGLILIDVFV